jgi:hypothetical protein
MIATRTALILGRPLRVPVFLAIGFSKITTPATLWVGCLQADVEPPDPFFPTTAPTWQRKLPFLFASLMFRFP